MKTTTVKNALKLTACAFAAVFAFQEPLRSFAASEPLYISDIVTASGTDENAVKTQLKDAGYNVLDKNLVGAMNQAKFVYIGYKTTDDPEKAITDLKTMNMRGNYSFPAYEQILENQRTSLERFSSDLIAALKDYRINYKKGAVKAIIAHDSMNMYLDDDTGERMGDLLLNEIREEMGDEAYSQLTQEEQKKHADMTTLVMQGNSRNVKMLFSYLAMAQDTNDKGWAMRLDNVQTADEMIEKMREENVTLSLGNAQNLLAVQYDKDAAVLAGLVQSMREQIAAYEASEAPEKGTEEEIKAYFDAHPDENAEIWAAGLAESVMLETLQYDGAPLGDLLLDEEYDFMNDADARRELYPIVGLLTEGQCRLLSYISMEQLLTLGTMDDAGWKKVQEETDALLEKSEAVSMFEGVRRDVFDATGSRVALTDEAVKLEGASGRSWLDEAASVGSYSYMGIAIGGLVLSAVTGYAVMKCVDSVSKNATQAARAETVKAAYRNVADNVLGNQNNPALEKLYNDFASRHNLTFQGVHDFDEPFKDASRANQLEELNSIKNRMNNQNFDEYTYYVMENGKEVPKKLNREQLDDLIEYVDAKKTATENTEKAWQNKTGAASGNSSVSTFFTVLGTVLCVVFALISIAALVMMIYTMTRTNVNNPAESPNILISRGQDATGVQRFTTYDVTKDLSTGTNADLCAQSGEEWIALYASHDAEAGEPILADSLEVRVGKSVPLGKTAVSMFGNTSAQDITESYFIASDFGLDLHTFLYFKRGQRSAVTAAAISQGSLVASCTAFAAIGALLSTFIGDRKRKKDAE